MATRPINGYEKIIAYKPPKPDEVHLGINPVDHGKIQDITCGIIGAYKKEPQVTTDIEKFKSGVISQTPDDSGHMWSNLANLWNPSLQVEGQWVTYAFHHQDENYFHHEKTISNDDSDNLWQQAMSYIDLGRIQRKQFLDKYMTLTETHGEGDKTVVANEAIPPYTLLGHFAGRVAQKNERDTNTNSVSQLFKTKLSEDAFIAADLSGYQQGNMITNIYRQSVLLKKHQTPDGNVGQFDVYKDGRSYVFYFTKKEVKTGDVLELNVKSKNTAHNIKALPLRKKKDDKSGHSDHKDFLTKEAVLLRFKKKPGKRRNNNGGIAE